MSAEVVTLRPEGVPTRPMVRWLGSKWRMVPWVCGLRPGASWVVTHPLPLALPRSAWGRGPCKVTREGCLPIGAQDQ
ncbi:protein of unknown function [Methylorubrum extorquens]|uniref:Uncharacterized protein n=1 Tax=Methylorubrum extorquens TaxID=408 RepID=A0A2N9ATE1_METEX|nr:protein of unknown function [Methylorubrum extorquens]